MIYITDNIAGIVLIGVALLAFLFVVGIWFRQRLLSKTVIVAVAFSFPLIAIALLMVPPAYRGLPDVNCVEYGGGKTVFVLESVDVRPEKSSNPYGPETLILIVRAVERWGDAMHFCVLPRDSEKAKSIIAFLIEFGFEPGVTTIAFGGKQEIPNVTWRPKEKLNFEKPGPPEVSQ
ncbi:MAG: hypothetical protein UX23_C0007G0021 [Parcubacteria group bacterium GW2011_GWB1_45_9]|nr:MAG: hypothetical protein UX23_C0007G0021 [Parcubacteria group bacterium GW2011_GWB1_45_9]